MSIQSARDFLTKITEDEQFGRRLGGCKTASERSRFAQAAGFGFTSDELRAARGEFQDRDLDTISGGGTCCGSTAECCTESINN